MLSHGNHYQNHIRSVIDMLSIDEAIAHAREEAKEIRENIIDGNNLEPYESYCNAMTGRCAEEHEQLAEWLEELKSYRASVFSGYMTQKMLKEEYNKAIDDLLGGMNQITYNCQDADELFEKICDLAEQLKAGGSE